MKNICWVLILSLSFLVACNNDAKEPKPVTTKTEEIYVPPKVEPAIIKGIDRWVEKIDNEYQHYKRKDRPVKQGMPCTSVHYFLDGIIVKADIDCNDSLAFKAQWDFYFREYEQELVFAWQRSEQLNQESNQIIKTDHRIYLQNNEIIKAETGEGEPIVITDYLKETIYKTLKQFR